MKKLIIDYCQNDCIILHEILTEFKNLVFNKWKINMDKYPTISSLSFAIYRKNYLSEHKIPLTKGPIFDFI